MIWSEVPCNRADHWQILATDLPVDRLVILWPDLRHSWHVVMEGCMWRAGFQVSHCVLGPTLYARHWGLNIDTVKVHPNSHHQDAHMIQRLTMMQGCVNRNTAAKVLRD